MRMTIVAAVAALFFCTGTIGCKTAAKMAWWKSPDATNVEATALAHSAPTLPADLAKQAEGLATQSPSMQMSGGEAAPYSSAPAFTLSATSVAAAPAVAPVTGSGSKTASTAFPATPYPSTAYPSSAYPSNGAPAYAATTTAAAAPPSSPAVAPAYATADQSADLGAVDMPYNPNAVPPARTIATAPSASPTATADRYGSVSAAPSFGGGTAPPVTTAAIPQLSGADRYGNFQSPQSAAETATSPAVAQQTMAAATAAAGPQMSSGGAGLASAGSASPSPVSAVPTHVAAANPSSTVPYPAAAAGGLPSASAGTTGSRYATGNRLAQSPTRTQSPTATQSPPASSPPVSSQTMAVTAVSMATNGSPYRPGGTASYQGSATTASAVEIASRPNPSTEQQVPNVAIPGATPEPSLAPRYR